MPTFKVVLRHQDTKNRPDATLTVNVLARDEFFAEEKAREAFADVFVYDPDYVLADIEELG